MRVIMVYCFEKKFTLPVVIEYYNAVFIATQYCDEEIVPLCAERRYQPIKIAYFLSLSILIGASSEISGAERTLLLISQFWTCSWKIFLKISNS